VAGQAGTKAETRSQNAECRSRDALTPDPARSALLKRIGTLAEKHGTRAFLVGGPVRDMLLCRPSPDLDVSVEAHCREIGAALARELGGKFVYHSRFLTGSVLLADSDLASRSSSLAPPCIDLAQTRTETYARPAMLPTVKPASIEADLCRRDFSINAIACDITPPDFGRLIDPCSGRKDTKQRLIRVLHDQSFLDDPTRAFRAIRFAVRLGFEIEPDTLKLMRSCIRERLPGLLTPERILYELKLICAEPLAVQTFEAVLKEGLLASCFPGSTFAINRSSFIASLHRLGLSSAGPDLLYLFVLSRLPLAERFPITRIERDSVAAVAAFGRIRARLARTRRPSAVYRLLKPLPTPALELVRRLEPRPVAGNICRYLDDFSQTRLRLTGNDLRRLGLRPGPEYRRVLDKVRYARLDGKISSAEDEFALARSLVRKGR